MSPTKLFIARPTLVFVTLLLVALIGGYAWQSLVRQQFPNVDFPVVSIDASYSGASPTQMRDAIVKPLEDQIAGAPNLQFLTSSIQEGRATISATFDLNSDKNADLVAIQDRVQAAQSQLPSDLKAPTVSTFDPSQTTVVGMVVSSKSLAPSALAMMVTNRIVPELEQISGVSSVQVRGAATPAMIVQADPQALAAHGATLNDIVSAISANNNRAPGGYATSGSKETSIDIRGDVQDPATVANLLLPSSSAVASASSSTGTSTESLSVWGVTQKLLHVGDVATVAGGEEPQRSYSTYAGKSGITLSIVKSAGASEVSVAKAVLAAIPALAKEYANIDFSVTTVSATQTQQDIDGVMHTLLEGTLLTAIVMVIFLGSWRNAVVVMLAIPTSLGITLGVMKLLGFTLDTISLMAMTLVIGILVDDSIVVLENIERHRARGEGPLQAALNGRIEIGLAAVVVTLVDVVVFVPIAFLPGQLGRILNEFGLTVAVATLTSLFTSFTITPALAAHWSLRSVWRAPAFIAAFERGLARVRSLYVHTILAWSLRRPTFVVGASLAALVASIALVPLGAVGFEFMPPTDRGMLTVQFTFPAGTAVGTTRDRIATVEQYVMSHTPDLKSENAIAGGAQSQRDFVSEAMLGQITVQLSDDRKMSTDAYVAQYRRAIPALVPQANVVVIPSTSQGGGVTQPISYTVSSNANNDPTAAATQIAAALAGTPGAVNVTSGASTLVPQVSVEFNRDAARTLDVSIGTAAAAVRAAFGGDIATTYATSTGIYNVDVIYPQSERTDVAAIAAIAVRATNGNIVHIGDIATLKYESVAPLITRENRRTNITVGANVAADYAQSNVENAFKARVAALHLPADIKMEASSGGMSQSLAQTISGMATALGLAFVLVYLLMVALFNSYRSPAIILFAVPLAVIGALGSLALTHETLNLFSLIGMVLLIGLVVKNGILLVDFANRERDAGKSKLAAIVSAAETRFRPIVMTTIAMIAGMSPLALALERGAAVRQSLGVVVIGGLTSSLLLTLVIVPIAYVWISPKFLRRSHGFDETQFVPPLPLQPSDLSLRQPEPV
jgi:HAE1 family hydrophobic/amphiphilic exporter-1